MENINEEVIYLDTPENSEDMKVSGKKVIFTGVSLHFEPSKYKNYKIVDRFLKEGFIFFFDDEDPEINMYSVPALLVFAHDNEGGFFATTKSEVTFSENFPLYYISKDRKVMKVEGDSRLIPSGKFNFKELLKETDDIKLYNSLEEAKKDFDIHFVEE